MVQKLKAFALNLYFYWRKKLAFLSILTFLKALAEAWEFNYAVLLQH